MDQSYASIESPLLPSFAKDTVCVGHIEGHWYRLQIIEHYSDSNICLAKYLDFGGYCQIPSTELRQIRTDFMTVPFQAIECLLSDIKPKGKLTFINFFEQPNVIHVQITTIYFDFLFVLH